MAMALSLDTAQTIGSRGPSNGVQGTEDSEVKSVAAVPALQDRNGRSNGSVRVFECVRGGQRVFSDQSCAPDAGVREIDVAGMNTYVAPPVRIVEPATSVPEPRARVRPAAPPRRANAAECDSLQREIDHLNARMRAGYSSGEGESLRTRWHELDDRYRDLHCLRG